MTSMVIFGELFVGDFGYKFKFNHQTLVIQKTTMEWLTLYLVHHCLLFLWIESHHPNIKHRTCMVPMECGNSLHPPWFLRGCFILGGWDYLVNMLYNSSWFMFGKVLSMCYALIFGMFMYTVYIFLHCWPFTAGKL